LIEPQSPWLRALQASPDKVRQIQKFAEILAHRAAEAGLVAGQPLRLLDMGCGKGYLTFAAYDWLRHHGWPAVEAVGVEQRAELVELCNRVAGECSLTGLKFERGSIDGYLVLPGIDSLMALHACDTATDDAIAKGVEAGAKLIIVAPCCHKQLRPQLRAPPVLSGALNHGLLLERQAEFVTDALRAALLEWAGYDTKVFEFVSTEHTAKNLMITAVRHGRKGDEHPVKELAAFYGIRQQRLAAQLGFSLGS
jgi:SAM-dependent methyltransferase